MEHQHQGSRPPAFDLRAALRIAQDPTVEHWESAACRSGSPHTRRQRSRRSPAPPHGGASSGTAAISSSIPARPLTDPAWEAGRNYQLFRAMLAANRSGKMPTLFNGGPIHHGGQSQRAPMGPRRLHRAKPTARPLADAQIRRRRSAQGRAGFLQGPPRPGHGLGETFLGHRWRGVPGGHRSVRPAGLHHQGWQRPHRAGMPALSLCQRHGVRADDAAERQLLRHGRRVPMFRWPMACCGSSISSTESNTSKNPVANSMPTGRLVIYPGNAVESHAGTTNDAPTVAGLHRAHRRAARPARDRRHAGATRVLEIRSATLPPVPVARLERRAPARPGGIRGNRSARISIWNCRTSIRCFRSISMASACPISNWRATRSTMATPARSSRRAISAGIRPASSPPDSV